MKQDPYREPGVVDRAGEMEEKLDKVLEDLEEIGARVKKPQLSSNDTFWLGLWPRILWPLAAMLGVGCLTGYMCKRIETNGSIEVARLAGPTAIQALADAGAK